MVASITDSTTEESVEYLGCLWGSSSCSLVEVCLLYSFIFPAIDANDRISCLAKIFKSYAKYIIISIIIVICVEVGLYY